MMISFALDPAIGSSGACGVALAVDGVITHAGIIRKPKGLGNDLTAQYAIAEAAHAWLLAIGRSLNPGHAEYIAEFPVARQNGINPNQALVPMAAIVGALSGMLPATVKRFSYIPEQWKSNLEKTGFTQRILSRLSPQELAVVNAIEPPGLRHNAVDAIGLILHHVGRLAPRRVISRD